MKKIYAVQIPVDMGNITVWEDMAYFETQELRDRFIEKYMNGHKYKTREYVVVDNIDEI